MSAFENWKHSPRSPQCRADLEALLKALMADGRLIEAGFACLATMAIEPSAPEEDVDELRMAFFAGAQHLWAAVLECMVPDEPGAEASADARKMLSNIGAELRQFGEEFMAEYMPTHGNA